MNQKHLHHWIKLMSAQTWNKRILRINDVIFVGEDANYLKKYQKYLETKEKEKYLISRKDR